MHNMNNTSPHIIWVALKSVTLHLFLVLSSLTPAVLRTSFTSNYKHCSLPYKSGKAKVVNNELTHLKTSCCHGSVEIIAFTA